MGNQISSSGSIPPISAASTVVGFVSFIFTLATALRVFWANLRTLGSADREVRDVIPNLKQALYEERTHLRLVRRRCKAQYEEAAFRVLAESIRRMISDFKHIEQPFVVEDPKALRGRNRASTGMSLGKSNGKRDRDVSLEFGVLNSSDDYYLVNYRATSLGQKFTWLRTRNSFIVLSQKLSSVQTRRIARQQTDLAIDAKYLANAIGDLQDQVQGMEHALSRRRAD